MDREVHAVPLPHPAHLELDLVELVGHEGRGGGDDGAVCGAEVVLHLGERDAGGADWTRGGLEPAALLLVFLDGGAQGPLGTALEVNLLLVQYHRLKLIS